MNRFSHQGGLSLIELMISITLGLILTTAILNVTLDASRTNSHIQANSEMLESGRFINDKMSRELRLAGYIGRLSEYPAPPTGGIPSPCSTTAADLEGGLAYPVVLDNGGAGNYSACGIGTLLAGADVLVVRRAGSIAVTTTVGLDSNQYYLQSTTEDYVFDKGSNSTSFVLTEKDGVTLAGIRPFYQTIYFVGSDNVFRQARLINGRYDIVPLIEGVDDFQVEAGIDRSATPDGVPNASGGLDAYVSNPSSAEMLNIVGLKTYFLIRSTDPVAGTSSDRSFSYAGVNKVPADFSASKNYPRKLFSQSIRIENVSIKRNGK